MRALSAFYDLQSFNTTNCGVTSHDVNANSNPQPAGLRCDPCPNRPRPPVPCPRNAEDTKPEADDRLREGDRVPGRSGVRGPVPPPGVLRRDRPPPRVPDPGRWNPVRPGDARDRVLREVEAREEVRHGMGAGHRVPRARPRRRAPRRGTLVRGPAPGPRLERVNLLRELEVQLREPAPVVGREGQPDLVPRVHDVRMVVHRLREGPDLVDEREGLREVLELPGTRDRAPDSRPRRDLLEAGGE